MQVKYLKRRNSDDVGSMGTSNSDSIKRCMNSQAEPETVQVELTICNTPNVLRINYWTKTFLRLENYTH